MTFPYLNETEELTDAVRARVGGSFIRLTDGVCHYEITQHTTRDTPVVLIHGFSVPYFIWDPTFDFLTRSGYRVLRYDLFGRGFSDRPRARYDIHLFVRQLKDLLNALGITEPVHLAGLSMGGPISAAFLEKYPERAKSHILIDPAGAKPIQLSTWLKFAGVRIASELGFGLWGNGSLVKSIASDFFDPEMVGHFAERYKPQMKIKGFKRALLSTIRSGMLGSFLEIYRRVGTLKKPTLLVWGRNDFTVPIEQSGLILEAIPHAEFHPIENCGHLPHYEKAEEVNPILLKFLTANSLPS